MMDERARRGLESYVATFLKDHVAPALFDRDEVRKGLGAEGLERVRREVLARLEEAEHRGLEDRGRLKEVLSQLLGAALAGPGGAGLLTLLKTWLDERPPTGRETR